MPKKIGENKISLIAKKPKGRLWAFFVPLKDRFYFAEDIDLEVPRASMPGYFGQIMPLIKKVMAKLELDMFVGNRFVFKE